MHQGVVLGHVVRVRHIVAAHVDVEDQAVGLPALLSPSLVSLSSDSPSAILAKSMTDLCGSR